MSATTAYRVLYEVDYGGTNYPPGAIIPAGTIPIATLTWLLTGGNLEAVSGESPLVQAIDNEVPVHGITVTTNAGTPTDAIFATAPPDGTLVLDTTASKLWARIGGVWKGAVLS